MVFPTFFKSLLNLTIRTIISCMQKCHSPLLDIYPDKTKIWKDKFNSLLIAVLFAIPKIWKQPKCPSTNEWWMMVCHIFIIYLSNDIYICMLSHVQLFDPMNCSPPGSSVHGIFQARTLEWVAVSYSRGSSQLKDWNWVSCISWFDRWIFTIGATQDAHMYKYYLNKHI